MALPSGLSAQLGVAAETTYGTLVTVNRFFPLVDEDLTGDRARLESAGIIAGARVVRSQQWASGKLTVEGDVGFELYQQSVGLLFEHMLGAVTSTASAGIATHTFTPGDLTGKSLTVQVGKPMTEGTVVPFTYGGVKVQSWELAVAAGQLATLGLTLVGQTETTGVALATASYGTDAGRPYRYIDGSVTIAGTDVCVRELTISGQNNLAVDRECVGQATIDEPLEAALREYSGQATLEFSSTDLYNRFVGGTETALVLSFSASASAQVTLTSNVRFDGVTPTVGGPELVVPQVPFKCVASTTADGSAITIAMKNSQTSP